jgi:glucosamine-6-phosphate deaminase
MALDVRFVPGSEFGAASLGAFLEALAGFPEPVVGLATGNTPLPLYAGLRVAVEAGRASVAQVRPFAIDEYDGPGGHPCSNRTFFARWWETIPGARPVEQFVTGREPTGEVTRFAARLEEARGLDVAVLGIGMNGHLAFNEPGTGRDAPAAHVALTKATRASARVCWGVTTPTHGYTLGLRELLGARLVLLLASGGTKAAIVARALEGPVGPACPASFVREHPGAVVVLDEAAASGLREGR